MTIWTDASRARLIHEIQARFARWIDVPQESFKQFKYGASRMTIYNPGGTFNCTRDLIRQRGHGTFVTIFLDNHDRYDRPVLL